MNQKKLQHSERLRLGKQLGRSLTSEETSFLRSNLEARFNLRDVPNSIFLELYILDLNHCKRSSVDLLSLQFCLLFQFRSISGGPETGLNWNVSACREKFMVPSFNSAAGMASVLRRTVTINGAMVMAKIWK